ASGNCIILNSVLGVLKSKQWLNACVTYSCALSLSRGPVVLISWRRTGDAKLRKKPKRFECRGRVCLFPLAARLKAAPSQKERLQILRNNYKNVTAGAEARTHSQTPCAALKSRSSTQLSRSQSSPPLCNVALPRIRAFVGSRGLRWDAVQQ